ncbi:Alpha/Beta hydrolase protein [Xylogone sp. PMI_703]|nr:Alpha/Beta hydrolase protein [Xylogone sp. PMI_703]
MNGNPSQIPKKTTPSFTWPETKTYIYKSVGEIDIEVDVLYFDFPGEVSTPSQPRPILLNIHGGGWISGIRSNWCRPLIYEFLQRGFVVASIDYRLVPESDFVTEQLEDIRDTEIWLKNVLPDILKRDGGSVEVDTESIVVSGESAGSLLAAFTPKLWTIPPKAILLIYGPTDMSNINNFGKRPLIGGQLPELIIPEDAPPELLEAVIQKPPPTHIPSPRRLEDFLSPRSVLGLVSFRKGVITEFLLRGLVKGKNGVLKLPEKGSVGENEIKSISPIHFPDSLFVSPDLKTLPKWPPTYQYIGSLDEAFDESHVLLFDKKLKKHGIPSKAVIVEGKGHAFDMEAEIGDQMHHDIIRPAAEWVIRWV